VLTVTTDQYRRDSMLSALRRVSLPRSPGPSLFWFALRDELHRSDPIAHHWHDGAGQVQRLV
jgi:hypothetical protein